MLLVNYALVSPLSGVCDFRAGMGTVAQTMARRLAPVPAQASSTGGASMLPTFALLPATQTPHSHSGEASPAVTAGAAEAMHAVSTRTPHDQMDAAHAFVAVQDLSDIIEKVSASDMSSGDVTAVRNLC